MCALSLNYTLNITTDIFFEPKFSLTCYSQYTPSNYNSHSFSKILKKKIPIPFFTQKHNVFWQSTHADMLYMSLVKGILYNIYPEPYSYG